MRRQLSTPIEQKIGYVFQYRPTLVKALTHPAAQRDFNWELLETFGDAVLDLTAAVWILETYREALIITPGFVTQIRSLLVCNHSLARFARELELPYMIHTGGKEHLRYRSAVLADAFEALVGAVYFDALEHTDIHPLDLVRAFVDPLFQQRVVESHEAQVLIEKARQKTVAALAARPI
jgi:ribonuclease-3